MCPFAFSRQKRPLAASALQHQAVLRSLCLRRTYVSQQRPAAHLPLEVYPTQPRCLVVSKSLIVIMILQSCAYTRARLLSKTQLSGALALPVIIGIIEWCCNHHDAGVASIDKLYALEGVGGVLFWVCQMKSWLLEPLLLCSIIKGVRGARIATQLQVSLQSWRMAGAA